ncbi:MAG: alanine--tRNA ligase, partial [Candidatus Korarchaeota archaeon]
FWTLNPDRNTCGDSTCEGGYHFLGKGWTKWDFHDSIREFESFFEKHEHKRIEASPVIARWRDDIYFTIASIAIFQPYVTGGIVPPPANPLVVSQPCIRFGGKGFSDVDSVGKTGRHLSMFIMGGQHAFLSQEWPGGYWMDKTIELNFKFLTEIMKIPPIKITYIEDVWRGGGNMGPSLESFADGLEIVNSVFMRFKELEDGSLEELPIRVVDVGWGVERIGWYVSGTPTVYEVSFGEILKWILTQTGLSDQYKEMAIYMKSVSGLSNFGDSNLEKVLKGIVEYKKIKPILNMYAVLDHIRTVIFALADGAIPSNVGGGYNLRVLLRRAISLASNLNIDLIELGYKTMEYYSKSYEKIKSGWNTWEDLFKVEKERMENTATAQISMIERMIERGQTFSEDVLETLFTAHGIQPETVREIADKKGIHVEIPDNFYENISEKQRLISRKQKATEQEIRITRRYPTTEMLYYLQPSAREFDAKVIGIENGWVILDKTLFYPTSGGQIHDTGLLNGVKVTDVVKVENIILHRVENVNAFKEGMAVHGIVDLERRMDLSRHHTATHIINGAARIVLGSHVWQAGAEKTPDKAHLDITHYKSISPEEIMKITQIANKIVYENIKVNKYVLPRTEAEQRYGYRIYQGGAVPGGMLRIVEIPEHDVEACGGLHLDYTGQAGPIIILSTKRIQDGIVRIEFVAGRPAVERIIEMQSRLENLSRELNAPEEKLLETIKLLDKTAKSNYKMVQELSQELAKRIISESKPESGVIILEHPDANIAVSLVEEAAQRYPDAIAVALSREENHTKFVIRSGDAAPMPFEIVEMLKKKLGAQGGGGKKKRVAMGVFPPNVKKEDIKKILIEVLRTSSM